MDEKLKEFVAAEMGSQWNPEECEHCKDIEKLTQAVAAFTEKRVLEEIQFEIGRHVPFANTYVQNWWWSGGGSKLIDQRLAALKAGKENQQ